MATKKTYPYIGQSAATQRNLNIMFAAINSGVPIGLVGDPGVGKTATIQTIAEVTGRELVNLSLSTLPSEDVAGLPTASKIEVGEGDDRRTVTAAVYTMPKWQQRILMNPHSILFLDEFSTAIPSTQHAFLQLVQDRRFPGSDERFSDDVAIIIAMNPAEQAGGTRLDTPISNRFVWMKFETSFDDWEKGFLAQWRSDTKMDIKGVADYSAKELEERASNMRTLIDGYLNSAKGARILNIVPTGSEVPNATTIRKDDASALEVFRLAWPSQRSWENLARVLTYLNTKDATAVKEVVNGSIGFNAGLNFYSYYTDHIKGIDIETILRDPDSVDWNSKTIDDSASIFNALIELAKTGKFEEALKVYISIYESGALELLSGNRVNDLYKADYLSKYPREKQAELSKTYIKYFGAMMKKAHKG